MKGKKSIYILFNVLILFTLVVGTALAEDGLLFRRNVSKTPEMETEKAGLFMMDFYVPAQHSDGTPYDLEPIPYVLADGSVSEDYAERYYAKPLFSVYIDGNVLIHQEATSEASLQGGVTFGNFDAYVGYSFDDGTTWKTTNLSRSADLSSFILGTGEAYPGDVHNVVHQVFGDNVLVAWVSKYCEGGSPLYTLKLDDSEDVTYLTDLEDPLDFNKDAVYLYDLFGVGGTQGSVDYTEQGHPEVGEIPFSCVWTARGKVIAGNDPSTDAEEAIYVMWTKPERLTSGLRDANLPAVDCAMGAGCMVTWQEDPDGLRPGQGLGPGEGWSGAVAWQQTDIWYSHISQYDFDKVFDAYDTIGAPLTMFQYHETLDDTMPKVYVPMAMPVRLTDNAQCKAGLDTKPFCYIDFDTIDDIDHTNVATLQALTAPETDADFCSSTYTWDRPDPQSDIVLCVADDLRIMDGRVASTRVRMNLKPYGPSDVINDNGTTDITADDFIEKSAWIVMAAEESKALGDTADPLDPEDEPVDIGKNIWYYSFDPFKSGEDELGENIEAMVMQGGLLNQPAVCKDIEDEFCTAGVDAFYDLQYDARDYPYYLTEISRRFALTTNSVQAAVDSEFGLSAMLIYKQGIINQGGPADILLRRTLIPDTFDPLVDNPYAFENMDCEDAEGNSLWVYTDDTNGGFNPNYLQGVCLAPAINISGSTIVRCTSGTDNDACAATFPVEDDGSCPDCTQNNFPKVYEWRQIPYEATAAEGDAFAGDPNDETDLDDQTWENPFDVAKGHRGFLDGDYVMMMYAWSPNWNSNAVGNDHYNLYARRSFDGGATWTTTPASWCGPIDGICGAGTTYPDYYYGTTIGDPVEVNWTYAEGAAEQGRNVSLLTGNQVTILDPRYSPTGGMKLYPTIRTDWLEDWLALIPEELPYDDDGDPEAGFPRDPSKYFMVYETGDNTTVEFGEATPLDLFYSRATVYGDFYELDPDYIDEETGEILDYRWNWVENKQDVLSGEAAMLANPGGTFMYAVWNQWKEEIYIDADGIEHVTVFDADMPFRRFLYLPDWSTVETVPLAYIIYQSDTAVLYKDESIITLIGSARDLDKLGDQEIVAYRWTSSLDGVLSEGQVMQSYVRDLSQGVHIMTFQAQDAEGFWSPPARTYLLVADEYFSTGLPIMVK